MDPRIPDMSGKVAVVTGGNSGIGLETCVALAGAGSTVVLASRDAERGRWACQEVRRRAGGRGQVVVERLDLASLASVEDFAAAVLARHERLDVLVNNAGLVLRDHRRTDDGFEMTVGVNHLGHFHLTGLLLDRLRASAPSRVVTVSSIAHRRTLRAFGPAELSAGPDAYNGFAAYGRSKLANIAFTRELARRVEGSGVTATCLHPGNVRSGIGGDGEYKAMASLVAMFGRLVLLSPARGARTSVFLATTPDPTPWHGRYVVRRKVHRPSKVARDDEFGRWLWAESERLVAAARARSREA